MRNWTSFLYLGVCECKRKYPLISSTIYVKPSRSSWNQDTINEGKYRCLLFFGEVFIKVMDSLVMALDEERRFLFLAALVVMWAFFADSVMEVPRYWWSPTSLGFFPCFMSKATSIRYHRQINHSNWVTIAVERQKSLESHCSVDFDLLALMRFEMTYIWWHVREGSRFGKLTNSYF